MSNSNPRFDVAVIGGGAAGMMAAGRAAERGASVVLLDKNNQLGVKLLITGKGRCNITQAEFDNQQLIEQYGRQGRFLLPSLSSFGVREAINFFEGSRVPVKIERGQRVFPVSDRAADVRNALVRYLEKGGVTVRLNTVVQGINHQEDRITAVKTAGKPITAEKYILCSGGQSYPATGSDGQGFAWLREIGHQVISLRPGLVPVRVKEDWVKDAQGLSLKNVEVSLYKDGHKIETRFGEALFTHFGLSGPIILDLSKRVGELLSSGKLQLFIDLKPALSFEQLDDRVQRDFLKYRNREFKNSLTDLLPRALIQPLIELSGIMPEKQANSVSRAERHRLVRLLKGLELTVIGLSGYDKAIITCGGVDLKEVNPRTMGSRLYSNLYFAGEILDIDGPTGGYNLQMCWSTGFLAGESASAS
ncbi:MAG: NAD(P)/FAD-dependent oxidoreductase [Syntrophomonadaceae bacterium]|nr:NAD(P)/FAD-dependent oxidoreductase [Syntrophomonadaceae bacterium]